MASLTCSFCNHANPAGARFCNECGSGLGLRPCARCDAINDVGATYCHHCGAMLNERVATSVGGSAQASRATDAVPESSVVRALDAVAPEPASPRPSSPPSVKELSSAAERLDAFWRDSLQAVEVARAMKPDAADAPAAHPVEVLPLRVDGESPVIDVASRHRREGRGGARVALAFVVLAVAATAAYYGYEQSTPRRSAASASAPIGVSPPAQSAPETPQPASTATETPATAPAPPTTAASSEAAVGASSTVPGTAAATPSPVNPPAATDSAASQASSTPATQQADAPAPAAPEAVVVTAPAAVAKPPAAIAPRRPTSGTRAAAPGASTRHDRFAPKPAGDNAQPARLPPTLSPAATAPVTPPLPGGSCTDSVAALGLCSR